MINREGRRKCINDAVVLTVYCYCCTVVLLSARGQRTALISEILLKNFLNFLNPVRIDENLTTTFQVKINFEQIFAFLQQIFVFLLQISFGHSLPNKLIHSFARNFLFLGKLRLSFHWIFNLSEIVLGSNFPSYFIKFYKLFIFPWNDYEDEMKLWNGRRSWWDNLVGMSGFGGTSWLD